MRKNRERYTRIQTSRDSHDPKRRYSGVYQPQGRMITDADWNALVEPAKQRLHEAMRHSALELGDEEFAL